jgi:hypothetical protein
LHFIGSAIVHLFEIVGGMIPLFAGGLVVCVFLTSLLPETWANRPPDKPIKNTCAMIFLGLWIVLGLRLIPINTWTARGRLRCRDSLEGRAKDGRFFTISGGLIIIPGFIVLFHEQHPP